MTIAIGGWLLLMVGTQPVSVTQAVHDGHIIHGYDTAAECEKARPVGAVCVPALSLVNR